MLTRVSKQVLKEYLSLMRRVQQNKCAVCGELFTFKDNAVLDHCHYHGHLRGALHRSCNSAEGRVLSLADKFSGNAGLAYLAAIASGVAQGLQLSAEATKVVNACNRGHHGVEGRLYIVGLNNYYEQYKIPKHGLIHPSHHLPFERKGVGRHKKNWR